MIIDRLKTLRKSITTMQREGRARQVISVLLQRLVKTTRIGATGGASPSPTKSNGDSTDAKQTERLLKGKGGGAGRRDSVVLERVVRRDDS